MGTSTLCLCVPSVSLLVLEPIARRRLTQFKALWLPTLALLGADLACACALFPRPGLVHHSVNLVLVPILNVLVSRGPLVGVIRPERFLPMLVGVLLLVLTGFIHSPYLLSFFPFIVHARDEPLHLPKTEALEFWWAVCCVVVLPSPACETLTAAPASVNSFCREFLVSVRSKKYGEARRKRRAWTLTSLLPLWHLVVAWWTGRWWSFIVSHILVILAFALVGRQMVAHFPDELLSPSTLTEALERIEGLRIRKEAKTQVSAYLPECLLPIVGNYLD